MMGHFKKSDDRYHVAMWEVYNFVEMARLELIEGTDLNRDNTIVVGLTRGGLIPAVLASHRWNMRMEAVDFSSRNGRGDDKNSSNLVPLTIFNSPNVIIVDDICDSGETLRELTDIIHSSNPNCNILTATIIYKEHHNSVYQPTFAGTTLDDSVYDAWVVFPWEMESDAWTGILAFDPNFDYENLE